MKKIHLLYAIALLPIGLVAQKGHGNQGGGHANGHDNGNKNDKVIIKTQPNVVVVNENKTKPKKVKYRHGNPKWGPSNGYTHRYIYFPEHQSYYDCTEGTYIYKKGEAWTTSSSQPVFISNIDNTKKVELDLDNEPKPQVHFNEHISLYRQ